MGNSRHSALLCLVTSAAISVGACSGYPLDALPIPTNKPDDAVELIPNADIELPVPGQKFANRAPPIAEPERAIAEVDWRTAEPLRIMLLEYTFAPHETVLYEGTAYRLILSNIGDKDHTFKAPAFLRAIAVRSLSLLPIEEAGIAKYERDDAGASAPPEGLLRLEVEEIPPPPPLTGDSADPAPANPFDSGEDSEKNPGNNPFDSGDEDEEDIGDEDEDASIRSSVPGAKYAALSVVTNTLDKQGTRQNARRSHLGEIASVDVGATKPRSAATQSTIDDEIEDDLPTQPEPAATRRESESSAPTTKPFSATPLLLTQQLTGDESEIEDDDFVYRPGSGAPIKPPSAEADVEQTDAAPEGNEEVEAEGETEPAPAETATPTDAQAEQPPIADQTQDDGEDPGDTVTDSDDPEDNAPSDAAKPDTAEASADDIDTSDSPPPLPKPRAKPAAQTATDEKDDNAAEEEDKSDGEDGAEDEDLADLEDDAKDGDEDREVNESNDGDETDDSDEADPTPPRVADQSKPGGAAENNTAEEAGPRQSEPTGSLADTLVEIEPAALAELLEKGVIEVPARRSKLIHFVAVRKGRYHVSTLSFIDNAHWMKGTIIIE